MVRLTGSQSSPQTPAYRLLIAPFLTLSVGWTAPYYPCVVVATSTMIGIKYCMGSPCFCCLHSIYVVHRTDFDYYYSPSCAQKSEVRFEEANGANVELQWLKGMKREECNESVSRLHWGMRGEERRNEEMAAALLDSLRTK